MFCTESKEGKKLLYKSEKKKEEHFIPSYNMRCQKKKEKSTVVKKKGKGEKKCGNVEVGRERER